MKQWIFLITLTISLVCTQMNAAADSWTSGPATKEVREDGDFLKLYAQSAVLMDGDTGRILYGKGQDIIRPMASTTKIMTCILALENGRGEDAVKASSNAASQPKVHLGVREGEEYRLEDLLYALMLESYNDCAYAIAEHVAGSAEKFAALMNEKAKKIGCTDSHFVTPNGLDAKDEQGEHHTTAYDLCRIMSYCAWKSPVSKQFLEVTQTRSHTFQSLEGTGYAVSNKNALLDMMDHVITGKTGYTSKAGYCYVAALEEGGRHYAIALLACGWPNHKNYKWSDAKTLFQYGMDAYHLYRGSEASMELPDIEIAQGCRKETLEEWATHAKLPVYVDTDITKLTFLKKDGDTAEIKKVLSDPISLPVKKGQTLGRVSYCMNGREIYSGKIKAEVSVKKWSPEKFFQIMWKEALLGK